MEPLHVVEYELSSEFASEVQRTLMRWNTRRHWRRDLPVLLCGLAFSALIIWLGLSGWILPGVGGGLLCVVLLFVVGGIYRRRSGAYTASLMALLALHTNERRVRIEFHEERVRLEAEFFRGEGTWTELEEAVVFSNFWLLRFSNGGQIVLPAAKVSPALESFLRSRAQDVDAPVHQT